MGEVVFIEVWVVLTEETVVFDKVLPYAIIDMIPIIATTAIIIPILDFLFMDLSFVVTFAYKYDRMEIKT